MSAFPRSYRNIEEFEREEIRPSFRIGFSLEDLVQEAEFEGQLPVDQGGDQFMLDSIEQADESEDDEDEDDDDGESNAMNFD